MQNTGVFPNMVLQMTQIGEESGSLDAMLSQGRRLLRARSRRRGRGAVQPDGADHHGGPRRGDRRHGHRDVPADLQARRGHLTRRRFAACRCSRRIRWPARVRRAASRPLRRQLPQRRHPPPAEDAGARLARAVRRAARRARRRRAPPYNLVDAALAVPVLRARRSRRSRTFRSELSCPARPLLGVQAPISPRYPLVELLTGALAVAAALRFGLTPRLLPHACFCCGR